MSFLPDTFEADYELIMSPYEANNLVTKAFRCSDALLQYYTLWLYFPWFCLHSELQRSTCMCFSGFFFKQMSYLNVVNFSAKYVHLVHIQAVALKKQN